MKLYYAETFNPRKACAVAKHLELPVDYVRVDLARGDLVGSAVQAFLHLVGGALHRLLGAGDRMGGGLLDALGAFVDATGRVVFGRCCLLVHAVSM